MSYKNYFITGFALLIVAALFVGFASAESITVINHSFQDPPRPDGLDGSTTDWPSSSGGGGVWNPVEPYFPGTNGEGVATGADGSQVYYFSGGPKYTYQVLADTLQAGTYTLTLAVGRGFVVSKDTDTFAFSLSTDVLGGSFVKNGAVVTVDGTPLAALTDVGTSLTEGAFVDRSITLVVQPDNPYIGQALQIDLGSVTGWGLFDNVRLDFAPVPEPGTLALLATGLIGLLACARRKRN